MNQEINGVVKLLLPAIMILAIAGFSACEKYSYNPPIVDPTEVYKLSADIQPVFNAKCVSCHGGLKAPDLRDGKAFQSLKDGNYVNLPAESSKLYVVMKSSGHISRSSETERLKVLNWISQGALNN